VTVNAQTSTSLNDFEVLIDFPRSGLLAFYAFNGNGSEQITGDPSNAFNMTAVEAPTFTFDRFGNESHALNLNGSQYAKLSKGLVPQQPWTVSFGLTTLLFRKEWDCLQPY
jgi:hypothetical protein